MNCVKRAMCYIGRKRTKSLLLLFIFMVAISTVLGTLSVLEASALTKKDILKNTNAKVILESIDSKHLFDQTDVQKIMETENVNSVNRTAKSVVDSIDFYPVTGNEDTGKGQMTLLGYDDMEKDSPFMENVCRLVQGNFPKKENEVIINQNLADINQLEINDDVTFLTNTGEQVQALVTGFYLTGNERQQTEAVDTVNRIENQVYATSQFAVRFNGEKFEKLYTYVDDPIKIEETAEKLSDIFKNRADVSTMDNMYQQMKYSIIQIERIARLIFILAITTGVFVVGMLLSMWLRNRKVEIAVLISLGITKIEVFFQMLIEIFALSSLGMIISVGIYYILFSSLEGWINSLGNINFNMVFSVQTIGRVWIAENLILIALMAIAAIPLFKKKIKDTLSEMEG